MKRAKGFSLIELLIVVAIILIIAAIAIPNLLRSRMAANEASAAESARTIGTANITYSSVYGIGFALQLSKLGPAAGPAATSDSADLIDSTLGVFHLKSGYDFSAYVNDGHAGTLADPVTGYTEVPTPATANNTGHSTFCVDGTSVVRKDPLGAQVAADTPGTRCDPGDGSIFPPL